MRWRLCDREVIFTFLLIRWRKSQVLLLLFIFRFTPALPLCGTSMFSFLISSTPLKQLLHVPQNTSISIINLNGHKKVIFETLLLFANQVILNETFKILLITRNQNWHIVILPRCSASFYCSASTTTAIIFGNFEKVATRAISKTFHFHWYIHNSSWILLSTTYIFILSTKLC